MGGSTTPGAEGPTFAPPSLPSGWIAQWDSSSRKYYYVQLATGISQWEVPTEAVSTGTPTPGADHPYGAPPQLITHPDGSQTVKHADGTMEPIMADGTRGVDGASHDRGLGSMAMNMLLGGKSSGQGGGGGGGGGAGGNPLGALAGQFLGGGGQHSGQGGSGGGGSNPLGALAGSFLGGQGGGGKNSSMSGKIVGQLASSFFSGSEGKPQQPQNYHGGSTSGASHHSQGGLAGSVMGGMASMFGGKQHANGNDFGYSNAGSSGAYSGQAPTYQPPSGAGSTHAASPSASRPSTHQSHQSHQTNPSNAYTSPSHAAQSPHTQPYGQSGGGQSSYSHSHNPAPPMAQYGGSHDGPSGSQHGPGGYQTQYQQPPQPNPQQQHYQPQYSAPGQPGHYDSSPAGGHAQQQGYGAAASGNQQAFAPMGGHQQQQQYPPHGGSMQQYPPSGGGQAQYPAQTDGQGQYHAPMSGYGSSYNGGTGNQAYGQQGYQSSGPPVPHGSHPQGHGYGPY